MRPEVTDYREPMVDDDPRFKDPTLIAFPCGCDDTACYCVKVFFVTLDEHIVSNGEMRCHDCRGELHEWAPMFSATSLEGEEDA